MIMKQKTLDNYPDVLTPNDIMQILSIGRNKVYELLNDGTLKSIRIGRKHRRRDTQRSRRRRNAPGRKKHWQRQA